jgi:hypothetical protein
MFLSNFIDVCGNSGISQEDWKVVFRIWPESGSFEFGRESQLQRIERAAFLCCSLKLIGTPRSVEILERFSFSKSGVEMITCESRSALRQIERFWFYESSLKNICIPSQVNFIGESALAANAFALAGICEENDPFTIGECKVVDERDAIPVGYFGGGGRDVVSKYIRVIGHMCFSKIKFGSLNFAPDSELTLLEASCFELCLVQSITIPSSMEVIGRSNFRKARIAT